MIVTMDGDDSMIMVILMILINIMSYNNDKKKFLFLINTI